MRVQELIKSLQEFDRNARVVILNKDDTFSEVSDIEESDELEVVFLTIEQGSGNK